MPRSTSLLCLVSAPVLAVLAANVAEAQTWAPPVGVPNPPFGITQVAGPYTHYVDNTHAASTDTSNPNGSPAKPRRTIPTSLAAGAVVEVRGGPYSYSSSPRWTASGTSASPVFIRGVGQPVVNGGGSLRDVVFSGSYGVVEGFVFDRMQVKLAGSYLSLRSSEVKNYSPGSHSTAVGGDGTNLVYYDNHVHHNGDAAGSAEVDVHAFKFGTSDSNIWVVDNLIHENGGDDIQLGDDDASEPWVHHIYFGRNTAYGSRENCVDIKRARDIIVSQNDCSGYRPTSSSSGETIVVHNAPERVWILNNKIHDTARGVVTSSNGSSPIYVVGNLFYRIKHPAGDSYDPANPYSSGHAIQSWTTGEMHIVNNTIHDVDAGIAWASGDTSTVRIVNNVIGRLLQTTHHVVIESSGAATRSTISNTLMQAPSRIKWGTLSTVRTVAALKSAFPSQCGGCTDVDPQFANAAAYDLRPGPASPLLDSAVVDPVYDTFRNRYGISIARDFTGASRPQGYTWDMGAYEGAGAPPPDPVLVSVGDVAVTEGNSGSKTVTFTVTLSAASTQTVTVSYATANGTATAGSDYTAASGSLSFSPGATSRTVAVSVTGDTAPEGNEDFLLNLSNPTNATLGDGQGRATIQNDDTVASALSIADASTTEGNSATKSLVFTVTLSPAGTSTVTVNFATANGTATAGSDYVAQTGNLSFTAGQTSKTIAVTVNGDTTVEPNETFVVNLSSPAGATLSDGQGQGTITNDDTTTPPPSGAVPVVWTSAVGVTVSANSLTKSASTAWGNAGAVSTTQIASGDGFVELTASETTTYRMLGLSNGNTNASYEDIDFALYQSLGQLKVFEAGISKGVFGNYSPGDTLRVAVVGGVVKYSRNGTVFYTSTRTPIYPLLVDAALYSPGATLSNAVVSGASAPPPPPPPPSGSVPVVWTSAVGVTVAGNSLTKTGSTAWGNAGAVSTQQIASGDGYVEFTASEATSYRMLGLSKGNSNSSYEDIDFAIYQSLGQLKIFESGTSMGVFGNYSPSDKLRVAVVGGVVKYSKNGTVFYTSTKVPAYPLLVDAALYTLGATLSSAVMSGTQ